MQDHAIFEDHPPETEAELAALFDWRAMRRRWLVCDLPEPELILTGEFLDLVPFVLRPSAELIRAVRLAQRAAVVSLSRLGLRASDLRVESSALLELDATGDRGSA